MFKFQCIQCGHIEKKEPASRCGKCGGILVFKNQDSMPREDRPKERARGLNRYRSALPVEGKIRSLGEGNTPLLDISGEMEQKEGTRLLVKCEFMNPTGSFKDRGMSVSLSRARELGIKKAVVASVGNASSSAAAYGALNGISIYAAVPESATVSKVYQALTYGAKLFKVPGGYSDSHELVKKICAERGLLNLTTTFVNPYNVAGFKTIGYEIAEELKKAPDAVLIPIGAGPLLAAVYQAFRELREKKQVLKIPKLVGIQSARCCPVVDAWKEGKEKVEPYCMKEPTIASGINDELRGYTDNGDYVLKLIRETDGAAIEIPEEDVIRCTHEMGEKGLYVEPASASGLYAFRKLREQGVIKAQDTVVMIATGSGLKNPVKDFFFKPPTITEADQFQEITEE